MNARARTRIVRMCTLALIATALLGLDAAAKKRDKDKDKPKKELTAIERSVMNIGGKFPNIEKAYFEIVEIQAQLKEIEALEDGFEKRKAARRAPMLKRKIERNTTKLDREIPKAKKYFGKQLAELEEQEAEAKANVEKMKEKGKDPEKYYQELDVLVPSVRRAKTTMATLEKLATFGKEDEAEEK